MTDRPLLGVLPLALCVAGMAWAFQWWVASVYDPPERLRYRAAAVAAASRETPNDLVIVGTCMSEQQIHAPDVQAQLEDRWRIHNLGGRASGPIDWYLMVKNKLPPGTIEGIVVAWIKGDLETNPSVWEGQSMELAGWEDVPALARSSCDGDPGCMVDLALRKGSFAYRYRGFLANWFWQELGARVGPEVRNDLSNEGAPAPSVMTAAEIERRNAEESDRARLTHAYLRALVGLAKEREIPIWFARMPERADAPDYTGNRSADRHAAEVATMLAEGGAQTIELPKLPMAWFIDDRHVNAAGVTTISTALADGLRGTGG